MFLDRDRVYRTVHLCAADDFELVRRSGLLQALEVEGWILPCKEVEPALLGQDAGSVRYVLEQPRIPFVSYPYEWCFSALKAAALRHLEIHLRALDYGVTMSDASAFNIQFIGANPVFIDTLSFVPYHENEIWTGHRQFCEQFLNPLLLQAYLGISHNAWYRGTAEGIPTEDLQRLIPLRRKLSWNVFVNVVLQSKFQTSLQREDSGVDAGALIKAGLPRAAFRRLLRRLHAWIEGLNPAGRRRTLWGSYSVQESYASAEAEAKKRFIFDFSQRTEPQTIWDLGCNTGEYAVATLSAGARYAVGFDFDQGALEIAFARATKENLALQSVILDAANPSSNQGWGQGERRGLQERANAEAILALALVHHLAIGKNIPLDRVVDWIVGLAPTGVVEFVPKVDPMVRRLLSFRKDIFPGYNQENFLTLVQSRASVVKSQKISATGRLLVWFDRT